MIWKDRNLSPIWIPVMSSYVFFLGQSDELTFVNRNESVDVLLAEHSAKVHDVSALVDELVVEDSLNPSDLYESIVQGMRSAHTVNVLYQEVYAATQRVSVRLSTL